MTVWAGILVAVTVAVRAQGAPGVAGEQPGAVGGTSSTTCAGTVPAPAVPVVAPLAVAFPLRDVCLLDGPLKHSQDTAAGYLWSLAPDRLLARYRQEAGLEKKAESYGGWEEKELPGVGLGFYLSGCAKIFAATGDVRFRERVAYCVEELAACQHANGGGYLLATRNGKRLFEEIESGDIRWGGGWMLNGECEPYYAMEKLFSGLRDAYRYAENHEALEIAIRLGDWLDKHMEHLSEGQMDTLVQCEYGGMNWVLSDLYADTGDARYLALSRRWHDKSIEDPLARGEDCLPGKHANTQFPKLCGLAARYPYSGATADREAAAFFWERVANHHSYATGGNSEAEHFGPPDTLANRLSPADTELCNSYNMIRLTQLLFGIQPKCEYAEYVERVLFNHVLAAQHPDDGRICYFTPLASGYARQYEELAGRFACCTCSSFDSYAKHAEFIYAHSDTEWFVNLFAPSEVVWHEKGVVLRQETRFPDADTARFTFACERPVVFTLCLRCPAFCTEGVSISLNDEPQSIAARPGSYAAIARVWNTGDTVELRFPMALRVESMPDNPSKVAFFAGPVLLAAELDADVIAAQEEEDAFASALVSNGAPLVQALHRSDRDPLEFALTGIARPKDVTLRPFFRLHDKPYAIYWDVMSEADWRRVQAGQEARLTQKSALDARTLDHVLIGDNTSEAAHHMKGENTQSGNGAYGKHMRRRWRHAASGGYFSYELAVQPGQPASLLCTYWGKEVGARTFDVLVNGTVIATPSLDGNHPEDFYDDEYPIPPALIKDAATVTVLFKPHDGNTAGGIFGIRVIK